MTGGALRLRPIAPRDRPAIARLVHDLWGSGIVVGRGTVFEPATLPGFLAGRDGETVGCSPTRTPATRSRSSRSPPSRPPRGPVPRSRMPPSVGALGVLHVLLQAKHVAEALLREPGDVVVLVRRTGDLACLAA